MTAQEPEVGLEDHPRVQRTDLDRYWLLARPCCLCSAEVQEEEAERHHSLGDQFVLRPTCCSQTVMQLQASVKPAIPVHHRETSTEAFLH